MVFIYQGTIRPVGPDTTPKGVNQRFTANNLPYWQQCQPLYRHGQVEYDEPLTLNEIHHYSLIPIVELDALNGLTFDYGFGKDNRDMARFTVVVDENYGISLSSYLLEYGDAEPHVERLNYRDLKQKLARYGR